LIGGTFGVLSGYYKGWTDRISSFVFIVLLSFPSLVLAILLTSLIERSLLTISLVLGLLSIAPVGRLARASTLQFADREFVLAARQIGATNRRIIIKEILPNVAVPMSSLALLGMAVAVVAEGGLAVLGLSVEKGITWGGLIQLGSDASKTLENSPWIAFFPIMMLFLTVLSLNFAGDRLRTYFDVKEMTL
jgi:peptide/nickel transport system permease protein